MELFRQVVGPDDAQAILWWQMCVRAVLVFAWGLVVVRLGGQRLFGKFAALDIVVTVMLGSLLSRVITGNAPLLAGLAATALLVLLHWLVAAAAFRWPGFGHLAKGSPVCLVRDGTIDWRAMRRTNITRHDLDEALRGRGLERTEQVRAAYLERSGAITVIRDA